jgi:hypothetical protein
LELQCFGAQGFPFRAPMEPFRAPMEPPLEPFGLSR